MASRGDIEAGKAHVRLYLKQSQLMTGLANLKKRMATLGTDLERIGQRFAAFGIPIAGVMGLGVQRFAEFDDQMRIVRAVSQSTEVEFRQLTETAKRLGATTSFTAVEVAGIMAELGKAGFVASEVDLMTEAVLNLARATATDAVLASGTMAATLRQFSLGAADATRVADLLTVGANASFNSVESLAEALSYAGPVASDFGMSLEDTLAILGGLGNVGIQGSNAGTALRRLLTISGAEAKKLKQTLGVSFTDAAGNVRPLVDSLAEVAQATAALSTGAKAAKFNEAFGLLGITSASVIGNSAVDIRALQKALADAGGTAAESAKQMDEGLGGSLRRLRSSIEGVAIAFGDALATGLGDVLAKVVAFGEYLRDVINRNQALARVVAVAVATITALGVAFAVLPTVFGVLVAPLTAVFSLVSALLSPVGLVTAALILGGNAFFQYTDIGKRALAAITEYLDTYRETVSETLGVVWDLMKSGNLEEAARIAWAGVKVVFTQALRDLLGQMNGVFGTLFYKLLTGDFAGAFGTAVQLAEAAWLTFTSRIVSAFSEAFQAVTFQIREFGAALQLLGKSGIPGAAALGKLGTAINKAIPKTAGAGLQQKATDYQAMLQASLAELDRGARLNSGAIDADLQTARDELSAMIAASSSRATEGAKKETPTPPKPKTGEKVPTNVGTAMAGTGPTATFSAAALAFGFGGTAEKTLEEIKAMRKSTEKNEAAAKEVRDALLKIPFSLTTLLPRFG